MANKVLSDRINRKMKALLRIYKRQNIMNIDPSKISEEAKLQQKTALRFVEDLITYQMWVHNISWDPLWAQENKNVPRHCTAAVASVIFHQTKKLSPLYEKNMRYSDMLCGMAISDDVFEKYVEVMGSAWFQEEFTWPKFTIFLTFLTTLAVHCLKKGQWVDGIALTMANFISSHLSGHISKKGGWAAFGVHCTRFTIMQAYRERNETMYRE